MLVLSRKPGEEILIGNDIRVKIVEVSGNKVRLGLTAPRELPIRRDELDAPPAAGGASGRLAPCEEQP